MNYCKSSTALLLLLVIGYTSSAQMFQNVPSWQFGVGGGVFVYQGDLSEERAGSYKTLRPAIQLFAGKLVTAGFGWRINLALGSIKGDEYVYEEPAYRRQRGFRFNSSVIEPSAMVEWNILGRNYDVKRLSPYVGLGIGYAFLDIERDYSRYNAEYFADNTAIGSGLAEDIERTPPGGAVFIPLFAGVRYFFSDKIGIGLETNFRRTSTDYLDGFSKAVNPKQGDSYYSHTLNVIFRLGKANMLDCPRPLKNRY
ncbi:MAG: DUF6089 family protein [Chitinophagaceae bacterium]